MVHPNSPELLSFIDVSEDSHFPIQNLPYGVFKNRSQQAQIGVAIGEQILNLKVLEEEGLLQLSARVFQGSSLNDFMSLPASEWQSARKRISELLRHDNAQLRDNRELRKKCFIPQSQVTLENPVVIGDYTDFYSSKEHASNVGSMFRDKDNPLLPNWLHLPVGYHGRASSVVASGTPIHRPMGQVMPPQADKPKFSLCQRLDFELEMAFFVGKSNELGSSIPADEAKKHIFGLVLMNDWSARDIQKWEYQPLGPFVSKSFATSISPWVVSLDALEPFSVTGPKQEPEPLDYLKRPASSLEHYDINLEVALKTAKNPKKQLICQSNAKHLYWSMVQQIAHHTVTGCNMRVGDLLASGTISGKEDKSFGSLLELSWGGKKPLSLEQGETRSFLEDHDEVLMSAWCQGPSYKVGFGEVAGKILPPKDR